MLDKTPRAARAAKQQLAKKARHSRVSDARKTFKAYLETFLLNFDRQKLLPAFPLKSSELNRCLEEASKRGVKLLDRIATDDRGAIVWRLATRYPAETIWCFFFFILTAWMESEQVRTRLTPQKRLERLECDLAAIDHLINSEVLPLLLREERARIEQLRQNVIESSDLFSRKRINAARTEFMRHLAINAVTVFGRPHFQEIAAVTNILIKPEDGKSEVDADNVRMAVGRRQQALLMWFKSKEWQVGYPAKNELFSLEKTPE